MAQYSFPFDSKLVDDQPDRPFNSADDRLRYGSLISNGIYPNPSNNLQVMSSGGMNIIVKKGTAWNSGAFYYSDSDTSFTLEPAHATNTRIDSVVLRFDLLRREVIIKVEKGTPSTNPLAPTVQRDDFIYDLQLARITIPSGVSEITQSNIKDMRYDAGMCGVVSGVVKQVDVTTLFNQYSTKFQELEESFKAGFDNWFETIKGTLEGDVAGNLQTQITDLQTEIAKVKNEVNATIEEVTNSLIPFKEEIEKQMSKVLSPRKLTAFYISEEGNDETGDGSSAKPFKTLEKAWEALPIYYDLTTAKIDQFTFYLKGNILVGNNIYLENKSTMLYMRASGTATLKSADGTGKYINLKGIRMTIENLNIENVRFSFTDCYCYFNNNRLNYTTSGNMAVSFKNGSRAFVYNCNVQSTDGNGFVEGTQSSIITVAQNTGSVKGTVILGGEGGIVYATAQSNNPTGTVFTSKRGFGQVITIT